RYQPSTVPPSWRGPTFLFNDQSNHQITFSGSVFTTVAAHGVDPNSADRGQVVLLLHAGTRLLNKSVIAFSSSGPIPTLRMPAGPFTVNGSEPLYLTIISYGNHTFQWTPLQVAEVGGQL